jgi:hypothetical protein
MQAGRKIQAYAGRKGQGRKRSLRGISTIQTHTHLVRDISQVLASALHQRYQIVNPLVLNLSQVVEQ